ncbi:MAG: transporter substrate-binding domain-containing protein, partial [Caldilineaceae bacterium]
MKRISISTLQPGRLRPLALMLSLLVMLLAAGCTVTPVLPGGASPTPAPVGGNWSEIQRQGSLRVGTSADYPPFSFYDEEFRLTGFDPTLMREIGERLGLEVRLTDIPFDGLFDSLQVGQMDAAIGAISVTTEREQQVDFTNIYFISEDAFLARADAAFNVLGSVEEVEAQARVGVQEGSVYQTWAQRELVDRGVLPAANLLLYGDISRAVKDLELGRIDLVILDAIPAERLAEEGNVKIVARGLNRQRYAIAVPNGADVLRRNLNVALEELRDEGRISELSVEFLGVEPNDAQPLPTFAPTVTPLPTWTPTPRPVQTLPPPPTRTNTPIPVPTRCLDDMSWVADLTFDDRNMTAPPILLPGQPFVKSWRILNSGSCTWDSRYRLGFVRGAQMSGQTTFISGRVLPGQTYDLSVSMVAPVTPGTYQGFWRMVNELGQPFGEQIWAGIRVLPPATATPRPTATPATSISFVASRTEIRQGESVTFTWRVTGVREVYFYREGQNWWNNGVAGEDSRTERPNQTTSYFLRVVHIDGRVEIREIRIYVTPTASAPEIRLFTIAPEGQMNLGQCLQVNWEVAGQVNSVNIDRNGILIFQNAPLRGSLTDCPSQPGGYNYRLTAAGAGGESVAVRFINVVRPTQPTATPTATQVPPVLVQQFVVDPDQIQLGQCASITWVVTGNPALIQIRRNGQLLYDNAPFSGNSQDCPPLAATYVYRIEVTNRQGVLSDVREELLLVQGAPATATPTQPAPTLTPTPTQPAPGTPTPTPTTAPEGSVINFFTVMPEQVVTGECVTAQWGYTGVDLAATSLTRNDEKLVGDPPPTGEFIDCPPGPGEY